MDIEIIFENATSEFKPILEDIHNLLRVVGENYPEVDGRTVLKINLTTKLQFFRSKSQRVLPEKPVKVTISCKYVEGKTALLPDFSKFTEETAEAINNEIQKAIFNGDRKHTLHLPAQVSIHAGKIYRFVNAFKVDRFEERIIM